MIHKIQGRSLPEAFLNITQVCGDLPFFFERQQKDWVPMTYHQALDLCLKTLAGLERLGFGQGDKLCLFSENRTEWMISDYAAQWMGGATTAIYMSSSTEQIDYILNHSESKILVITKETPLKRLREISDFKYLKYILVWDEEVNLADELNGVKVIRRSDFYAQAMPLHTAKKLLDRIKPEDLAVLLYTSGTTGEPKGVMLTQHNFLSSLLQMEKFFPIDQGISRTLSFLPLSHIYERSVLQVSILKGVEVYFSRGMDYLMEDLQEVRPHVMGSVPRIFEKVYAKIIEKVKNAPELRKRLFYFALWVGKQSFPYKVSGEELPLALQVLDTIADKAVYQKIRGLFGGESKIFISGGAPLSKEIAEFFFQAGFQILEGYGLSECSIYGANPPGAIRFGTVGPPFEGVGVKIAEDGEIWISGPQVMKGYYKKPDETAEVITEDGWFKTGDIGEMDDHGYLKITDRKKELIITAGGKNIAPQPIENHLKENAMIESVALIGDKRKFVSALIVPNLEMAKSWAKHKGLDIKSLEDCQNSEAIRDHFQRHIDKINEDLPSYSTIKKFALLTKPWSIETGELTPTMKLKRRVIHEKYDEMIDQIYEKAEHAYAQTVA